ncbi:cysteine-rich CWC family protein [Piscinibacter sp. XHJ-5]|uniref:cysteine-rich CWC family protein n=1 Tax=Piscinibacter sp. XHJ-5 TaxID=3037797 RepID=UPI002452D88B|nr:cysteine-rich CWC family protein [Piscinibacter sp. XHJ-5]
MTFELDTCARCGAPFRCGMNDAAPCACTGVRLDERVLARLRERYVGCLCLACLCDVQKEKAGAVIDRPACED